jgi:hypothetical protein
MLPFSALSECRNNRIGVRVGRVSPNFWNLTLAAPRGEALAAGAYENATRFPFQDRSAPGLDFNGAHRGCNQLNGRFQIRELVTAPTVPSNGCTSRLLSRAREPCPRSPVNCV